MRKLIMFNLINLDGYFEGEHKWELEWHQVDTEFDDFTIEQLDSAGGIIYGRVTYEGMASFWSSQTAMENDPLDAAFMTSLPKFVCSRTLDKAEWNNTCLINGEAVVETKTLKAQSGKDLFLFGSADLAKTFASHDLNDEYRLLVNPIVLGKGGPLFMQSEGARKMKLLNVRIFNNGNVLLMVHNTSRGYVQKLSRSTAQLYIY